MKRIWWGEDLSLKTVVKLLKHFIAKERLLGFLKNFVRSLDDKVI